MTNVCVICGSKDTVDIMISKIGCILTDGKTQSTGLNKTHCLYCGILFNNTPPTITRYFRSDGNSKFDIERHATVANGISAIINRLFLSNFSKINVLEIGGGNFLTSLNLSRISNNWDVTCLEPFPETQDIPTEITCTISSLERYSADTAYDFIYSNQVIEHIPDLKRFILKIEEMLKPNGVALFCCPTQTQITTETLFADHIYHFSPQSFEILTANLQISLIEEFVAPWDIYTHCYLVSKAEKKCTITNPLNPYSLLQKRQSLAKEWGHLDATLQEKISDYAGPIYLFGAGEYSQIVSFFAPEFFKKINCIVATTKIGARRFEKELTFLHNISVDSGFVFLSVRNEIQADIKNMLKMTGWSEKYIFSIP